MKCCIKSQIRQGEVSCWDHETGLMFLKVLSTVKHLPLKKYYIYYNKCLKFNVLEAYGAIPDSTWGTTRWPVWIVHQNHFKRMSYIKWMHFKNERRLYAKAWLKRATASKRSRNHKRLFLSMKYSSHRFTILATNSILLYF